MAQKLLVLIVEHCVLVGQNWNVVHPENAFGSTYLINCTIEMGNSERLSLYATHRTGSGVCSQTKCLLLYHNYNFTSYFIDNVHDLPPHTLLMESKTVRPSLNPIK